MVLLGDAAHTVHPLAGQGVNLGLRDVAELRDALAAAREAGRDIGAAHVLRRYARRRRSADTLDAWVSTRSLVCMPGNHRRWWPRAASACGCSTVSAR